MLNLEVPEASTIFRWALRVALVCFLTWLVRRPSDDQEEEAEENEPAEAKGRVSKPARSTSARSVARLQPRRDPYPPALRQRKAPQGDVDELEKPKPAELWEQGPSGRPVVLRRPSSQEIDGGSAPSSKTVASKSQENVLRGHERPVTFIAWNRDSNLLFTCGKDKLVCAWSSPDGELLGTYKGHSGAVWACSVTSDSRWLVTSGADRLVIVWEAHTSRELARVELQGVVRYVEWAGLGSGQSSATERFVTCHLRFGAHPPALTIWRFDGKLIEKLLTISNLPSATLQVRWGRGDYFVASAHDSGELIFWRADTGTEVKRLKAHDAGISKFDFSADRELVATVSTDMSVRIWDLGKGTEWKLLYKADTNRPLNAVAMSAVTRAAAVAAAEQRPRSCAVVVAGGQDVRDVAGSSSATDQFGTLLFKLGRAASLPCRLEANGVTKGHFGPVHTLAFARDGSAFASGSEDGCVRLHLLETNGEAEAHKAAAN